MNRLEDGGVEPDQRLLREDELPELAKEKYGSDGDTSNVF